VTWRPLLVRLAGQQAVVDERVEPVGEDVRGHPEVTLQLVELGQPEHDVPQDQRGPRRTDDGQGTGDGTRHGVEVGALHLRRVTTLRARARMV